MRVTLFLTFTLIALGPDGWKITEPGKTLITSLGCKKKTISRNALAKVYFCALNDHHFDNNQMQSLIWENQIKIIDLGWVSAKERPQKDKCSRSQSLTHTDAFHTLDRHLNAQMD